MTSPRYEAQSRMGVQPIEEMVAERATLVQQVSELRAKFGSGGTWDALRKMELARLKAKTRAEYVAAGVKPTEAMLDDEAHAHPDYVGFVTDSTRRRAEWVRLEDRITGINDVILRDNAIARHVSAEARLGI